MKTLLIIFFIAAAAMNGYAQYDGWGRIDTVTSGNLDDHNPQLDHGGSGFPQGEVLFEWLVFERWNSGQSSICAMKVEPYTGNSPQVQFDSTVVISPPTVNLFQEHPDICTNFYPNDTTTLAAWQENNSLSENDVLTWNIYFSYTSGNETQWSIPQMLHGAGDNAIIPNAIVRSFSDSSFILIWRNGNALMFSTFWNGQMTTPDTLAITNYDSTEFDFGLITYPNPTIAWTGKDSTGKLVCCTAQVTSLSPVVLSQLDTLSSVGDISDPKFMNFYGQAITFNVDDGGRFRSVFASYNSNSNTWSQQDLVADSLSDNLNAVGISFPIPVESSELNKPPKSASLPGYGFFAWERRSGTDTSLVFAQPLDTVKSTGYNRDPSISGYLFSTDYYFAIFPCVWESNRTGKSHIYARVGFSMGGVAINEPPYHDQSFVLEQNYPNPFNPTTAISYWL